MSVLMTQTSVHKLDSRVARPSTRPYNPHFKLWLGICRLELTNRKSLRATIQILFVCLVSPFRPESLRIHCTTVFTEYNVLLLPYLQDEFEYTFKTQNKIKIFKKINSTNKWTTFEAFQGSRFPNKAKFTNYCLKVVLNCELYSVLKRCQMFENWNVDQSTVASYKCYNDTE